MRTIAIFICLVIGLLMGFDAICAQHELHYAPGEVIVQYKSNAAPSRAVALHGQKGIRAVKHFTNPGLIQLRLPEDMSVEDALEMYRQDADVEYAEPNYYRYPAATIPNDSDFQELWGLNNTGQSVYGNPGLSDADIDAPEAWDITTGSSDIIIAVIDSGVAYNHPDLRDNIWNNRDETINGKDDDQNGYIDDVRGWDFAENNKDPMDTNDHGTHIAGTIAARGNNETGVAGVCWNATIMPLRFIDESYAGTVADEIAAINYAVENGARIINASYGSSTYSRAEEYAIESAGEAGVLFITGAGNGGDDGVGDDIDSSPQYPASYDLPNIISVAATDQDDRLIPFSNYGDGSVDVAAPGVSIFSTMARQRVWSDNFDDSDISDWTTGGNNNTWERTSNVYFSDSYCLTDSPGEDYKDNTASWAQAPAADLSAYANTSLDLITAGISENNVDFLYVQASANGAAWSDVLALTGNSLYWNQYTLDLSAYDGESTFYLRFYFDSDNTISDDGWYIDNINLYASSSPPESTEYRYMSGTSFAAPYVAGLAGLIWSINPDLLTMQEIKQIILNSVDERVSLRGKVSSEGRINAYQALKMLPAAPSDLSAVEKSVDRIDLAWSDNASDESGFVIERKKGKEGTYELIDTVSANAVNYRDNELSASTNYYYRVSAYNENGASPYSNTATAQTQAAETANGISGGGGDDGGGCFINSITA